MFFKKMDLLRYYLVKTYNKIKINNKLKTKLFKTGYNNALGIA